MRRCVVNVSFSLFSKQKSSSKFKVKVTPIFFSESEEYDE